MEIKMFSAIYKELLDNNLIHEKFFERNTETDCDETILEINGQIAGSDIFEICNGTISICSDKKKMTLYIYDEYDVIEADIVITQIELFKGLRNLLLIKSYDRIYTVRLENRK